MVRLGPNQVCFSSATALRQIYNPKYPFPKSTLYESLTASPAQNVFTSAEDAVHSRQRSVLEPGLSEDAVGKMFPSVDAKVKLAIERMKDETAERGASDIFKWWTLLAADIAGELVFGQSFGVLENGKVSTDTDHLLIPSRWVHN